MKSGEVAPSNILEFTNEFNKKALFLDDYTTCSHRADKLFWNIVQSMPKANSETATRADIRSMRLRAELLVLYEAFDRARFELDPKSKDYAELKKLYREVSSKVLLNYRKGYLSKKDFTTIKNHFLIIDEALASAKKKPSKIISGGNLPQPVLKNALNKTSIHAPRQVTPTSAEFPIFKGGSSSLLKEISIPLGGPFPLNPYSSMDTQGFIERLNEIYTNIDLMKNGTPEEKKWHLNEGFRLFFETPYFKYNEIKSINPVEAEKTRDKIIEFLDVITESRNASSLTEYDYHSILKIHNFIIFFDTQATGIGKGHPFDTYDAAYGIRRIYSRLDIRHQYSMDESPSEYYPEYKFICSEYIFSWGLPYQRKKEKFQRLEPLEFDPDPLNPRSRLYYETDMSNKEALLSQHELMEKSKFILEQSRKVQKILNAKTAGNINEFFEFNASPDKWLRPIHNPYLVGLFRKGILDVYSRGCDAGDDVPEAFFDNLEGLFSYYMEGTSEEAPPDLSLLGTISELKQLSRTLRDKQPHTELLAFMKEKPHLLYNPEIRNFFDALFFDISLGRILHRPHHLHRRKDYTDYPVPIELYYQNVEEEVGTLEKLIKDEISSDSIADPELLRARVETLAYYNEMLIRLKQTFQKAGLAIDDFPDQKERLEELVKLCQTRPELTESLGYVARVQLREQLFDQEINQDTISSILKTYAIIKTSSMDPMNVEPLFEQQMELHWQLIASKLMEIPLEALMPVLEHLFSTKGLNFDSNGWEDEGNLVFKNEQYRVDLKTWELGLIESPITFGKLPKAIAWAPSVAPFVAGEDLETLIVQSERVGKTKVYSFIDKQGIPTQIEDRNGTYTLYKKFKVRGKETWLQGVMAKPKGPKKLSNNFIKAFLQYQMDIEKIEKGPENFSLFDQGLYINPKKRHYGYILSSSGTKLDFEIKLAKSGQDLKCEGVKDLRGNIPSPFYQINNAASLKNKTLDFLKVFENPNQMLLWSKRGELKRVELIRYGLVFEVKHGKLHCLTEPYKGYSVNAGASDIEKKVLHYSLLLEHPDPKKPNKLLLANSDALERQKKSLLPKAHGFGKIALALHYMKIVYNVVKKGDPLPSFKKEEILTFKETEEKLSFTAFDLRPYTGEICKKGPKEAFELVKHAALTHQPVLVSFYLKRFPIKAAMRDQKLLLDLIQFTSECKEPALTLKLALKLLTLLSENNKLKKETKHELQKIILKNAKPYLEAGRRVPKELRLTKEERLQLNALLKKHKLEFYETRIKTEAIETDLSAKKQTHPNLSLEERIAAFESTIDPAVRLSEDQLGASIARLKDPLPLLFSNKEIDFLFETRSINLPELNLPRDKAELPFETVALDDFQADLDRFRTQESTRLHYTLKQQNKVKAKFIKKELLPKLILHEATLTQLKIGIETRLRREKKAEKQVAILSGETRIATFDELRLALIQGNLKALQKRGMIPVDYDIGTLETELIDYFDALSKRNATEAALTLFDKMDGQSEKEWNLMSDDLHRLLTIKRSYDPYKDPRLLIFEAQLFLNFKELPGGLNQLELLESLIADPSKLVQAPTGAGKTSVLSVMESLLKATGENLVIQQVLPSLYNQTHAKTQEVIGDLFNTLVMPLRFDLKMRLTRNEVRHVMNEEGVKEEQIVPGSIFKGIYEELYEVIQNKGCVLTDYKTFPLMEEKFLQIGQEFVEYSLTETEPPAIKVEHFEYLKKILILLRNKSLVSMDEYDAPNRPNQKLQLDLQMGAKDLAPFLIDTTLEIYDILIQDPDLGLLKNIQSDLTKETRQEALKNAATIMAKRLMPEHAEALTDYFLGINEDVLERLNTTPEVLDKMALCKDQFSIYLPLSLNYKQGSRYARSSDGSKTVPCHHGQKQDAKFGTIQEQLNYTIQDYLQTGIRAKDLHNWFKAFKPAWDSADASQKAKLQNEFDALFPDLKVTELAHLLKNHEGIESLLSQVNKDPQKIRPFLIARLQELKSSGYIISMDPLNAVNMSRAASGISATTGAPDSMHRQFKIDTEAIGQIKAGMAYRILTRAKENQILAYDPEHPGKLLKEESFTAIIDGSGAFNDFTQETAKALLGSNTELKQVSYHKENESIGFEGTPSGLLYETGFVFNQAHTRGTDILLPPDAHALLTISSKDGFRDFSQKEGRLRGEGQTFTLAMPKDQAPTQLIEEMRDAECVDAGIDATDIYNRCRQELPAEVRNEAMKQLLATSTPAEFVNLFKEEACNALFISKPQKSYRKPGSYFAERKHIQRIDTEPENVLKGLHHKFETQANHLGLPLEPVEYPQELLLKMPPLVSSMSLDLECELHVEQEEEMELELERELEIEVQHEVEEEQSSRKASIFYPQRYNWYIERIFDQIHKAYDPLIIVTEAFLPFNRNTRESKFKRLPFEKSMFNVGEVILKIENNQIKSAIIDDPLVDPRLDTLAEKNPFFVYDIRTDKVIGHKDLSADIINSHKFHHIIAQIKFFDGRTSGYTPQELTALKAWLINSGPEEMKRHLLDEVLFYRYREKAEFESSQLGDLFQELI